MEIIPVPAGGESSRRQNRHAPTFPGRGPAPRARRPLLPLPSRAEPGLPKREAGPAGRSRWLRFRGFPPSPTPPSAPARAGCCKNCFARSLAEGTSPDGGGEGTRTPRLSGASPGAPGLVPRAARHRRERADGGGKGTARVRSVETLGRDSPGREKALTAGKGQGGRVGEAGRVGEGRRSTFRFWAPRTDLQQGGGRDP